MQAANLAPGLENPDKAMPVYLTMVPAGLGLIIFIVIFAAATSTLGSILTLGSLFSRDVRRHGRPDIDEKTQTWVGRISMIVLLAFCILFAWFRPGLISVLLSMAFGGLLVMAPTIVAAFFWKRANAVGTIVSMAAGVVITAALCLSGWYPQGWWPSV